MLDEKKGTCCHKCGHVHVKGTTCPKPYLTGARSCKNRTNESTNEMFVGPRKFQTYMPEEWNYELLVKLFDEMFGQDLQDEVEGKIVHFSDLKDVLMNYGATHFQSKDINNVPILPRLVKILKDKGHNIVDQKQASNEMHTMDDDGPDEFHQVRADVDEERKGLWANIRAKRARGEKPARKGSDAYEKAVDSAERINAMDETDEYCPSCLAEYLMEYENKLEEAEYKGRKVQLGKPFLTPDGPKKRSVYVKNAKGKVVKVNFGDPNMRIKKSNPQRRKSYRARHHCDNPGPRWKANYWSCKAW